MTDIVRVLRIIEYVGPRDLVEQQILGSIHGTKIFGPKNSMRITVTTLGNFPDILDAVEVDEYRDTVE